MWRSNVRFSHILEYTFKLEYLLECQNTFLQVTPTDQESAFEKGDLKEPGNHRHVSNCTSNQMYYLDHLAYTGTIGAHEVELVFDFQQQVKTNNDDVNKE